MHSKKLFETIDIFKFLLILSKVQNALNVKEKSEQGTL